MTYALQLQVCATDAYDVLQLEVQAEGEGFRGVTRIYSSGDALLAWAAALADFRGQFGETVYFGDRPEAGRADFASEVFAADAVGHWALRTRLVLSAGSTGSSIRYQAEIEIGLEPQAVDRFIVELRQLAQQRRGTAYLSGRCRY